MRTTSKSVIVMTLFTALLMMIAIVARASDSKPLPLRESLEGSVAAAPVVAPEDRCSGPALLMSYAGDGTFSHVGKVAFSSTHCSYLTEDGQMTGRYGEGQMVAVTPAGDEIYATYRGHHHEGNVYHESTEIVGGTGRFSQATGDINGIVTVDMANLDVSIRGWGWILR